MSNSKLPTTGDFFGTWIPNGSGDVHVYLSKDFVVIGTNKSHKDKVDFSDLALVFDKDGYHLQYDNDGTPANVVISEERVKGALLNMLESLKP